MKQDIIADEAVFQYPSTLASKVSVQFGETADSLKEVWSLQHSPDTFDRRFHIHFGGDMTNVIPFLEDVLLALEEVADDVRRSLKAQRRRQREETGQPVMFGTRPPSESAYQAYKKWMAESQPQAPDKQPE